MTCWDALLMYASSAPPQDHQPEPGAAGHSNAKRANGRSKVRRGQTLRLARRVGDAQGPSNRHQPEQAEDEEAGAPAQPGAKPPGEAEAEREANGDAGVEDAMREPQTGRGEAIREHAERGGGQRGLAEPNDHPQKGQLRETLRVGRECGSEAPDDEPSRDEVAT